MGQGLGGRGFRLVGFIMSYNVLQFSGRFVDDNCLQGGAPIMCVGL